MLLKNAVAGLAMLIASVVVPALAQQAQPLRGTVEKADGPAIIVKQADGAELNVKLAENAKVIGIKAATVADLKPNDFIGVGAMPQPDGTQKAIQVTIFSESQRGTGEGFRPWDRPGSTMTNGTAVEIVTAVSDHTVTVKYKGGEQKIVIGPDAIIRMYVAGAAADLKPGTHVAVVNPQKEPDGSVQTARVNYGIGGMEP